jgi:hypothetical protein
MKDKISSGDWNKEYQYFLESPRQAPRADFTSFIKRTLHEDLNPRAWKVFSKLFVIHFISGTITLFFCPQLGVGFHRENSFLFNLFLGFGEYGCMVACGALFLGSTGLIAALLLRSQEIRVIRKTRALQLALLAFLSLGFFLSFQEAERALPISLMVAWIVGACLGGFFTFQLGWLLRGRIKHHLLS